MSIGRTRRQIVVLGGGGFSEERPEDPRLDDFALALTGKRKPRVCFVPTATGDSDEYIERFVRRFPGSRAKAAVLRLFKREHRALGSFVARQDVIYVGGGNTANALAVWRAHGVDVLLRKAWAAGRIMTGVSAGMICWFEGGVTDSFGPLAALKDGLGILPGSACPHYDGEARRRPTYHRLLREGILPAGYAAEDWVALHFDGRRLREAVTSRKGRQAYEVHLERGRVVERPIPTRLLP
jgi:dipeptidase E